MKVGQEVYKEPSSELVGVLPLAIWNSLVCFFQTVDKAYRLNRLPNLHPRAARLGLQVWAPLVSSIVASRRRHSAFPFEGSSSTAILDPAYRSGQFMLRGPGFGIPLSVRRMGRSA